MAERTRRELLGAAGAAAGLALGLGAGCATSATGRPEGSLRPPGARPEADFLGRCIRCGRCGTVCEAGCIRFGDALDREGATPYIVPTERACLLCMRCGEVCPSGALEPIPADLAVIASRVRMGVAEIDEGRCWARGGRGVCRACWYACPYGDGVVALEGQFLRPQIDEEHCVGCGLCAQVCPPDAAAIRVRPRS